MNKQEYIKQLEYAKKSLAQEYTVVGSSLASKAVENCIKLAEQLDEPPIEGCKDCRVMKKALALSKAMTSLLDTNGLLE